MTHIRFRLHWRHGVAALMLALAVAAGSAEGLADLPVRTISGKEYYCYQVQPGETLYSLQHRLGVSRDDILKYNPSAQDGLMAHSTLYFPVSLAPRPKAAPKAPAPSATRPLAEHEVKSKETIYGIARSAGVTVDELLALNPQAADGIRPGMKLRIPTAGAVAEQPQEQAAPAEVPAVDDHSYTLESGETLYGVAQRHGVTVEDILEANPGLSPTYYRGGQTIIIPEPKAAAEVAVTFPEEPAAEQERVIAVPAVTIDEPEPPVADEPAYREPEPVYTQEEPAYGASIAVLLPFMLSERTPGKAAQRYTDFYKGLLIAVDSTAVSGRPTAIYAYDTAGSADTIAAILRKPELLAVQAIIAPGDDAGLRQVGDFGRRNNITVINPFVVRDDSYLTNDVMVQLSIPSAAMQRRAVDGVMSRYGTRRPVVLHRQGAPEEQAEMAKALIEAYRERGLDPVTINFTGQLTTAALKPLAAHAGEDFMFILFDSKAAEAAKVLPALAEYRESLSDPSRVMLMGYPEWITFKGETRQNMQKANTLVYSRFFADPESRATRKAVSQFKYWYGSEPEAVYPNQGYLGIDLGMYLVEALRRNGGDFSLPTPDYSGIQNCYHVTEQPDAEGLVNDVIYFVNYRPSGLIDRFTY